MLQHPSFLEECLFPRWNALSLLIYEEASIKDNTTIYQADYLQKYFEPKCSYPTINIHNVAGKTMIAITGETGFDSNNLL